MSMIDCIEYSRLFDDGVHPQRWAEVGMAGWCEVI